MRARRARDRPPQSTRRPERHRPEMATRNGTQPADPALNVTRSRRQTISNTKLDELVEEATVDCYNEAEQITGLFTMIEEHLDLPFQTTVLGIAVTVTRVDVTAEDHI